MTARTAWSWRRHLLLLAGLLALGVAYAARLWADPGQRYTTSNPFDHAAISWHIGAEVEAATSGRSPYFTGLLNAPDGVNLLWNTGVLLPALLLTPLVLTVGPVVVMNLLLTLAAPLTAWSATLVLRRLVSDPAAVVGGLVFGFGPAITAHSLSHPNLVLAPLLPPLLWLGSQALIRDGRDARLGALLGVLAAAQLHTGEELLADVGIAGALVAVVLAASRPRAALAKAAGAAQTLGIAIAVFLLLAGPALIAQFFGPRRQHGSAFLFDYYKSDLASFVVPTRLQALRDDASVARSDAFRGGLTEQGAYLGWPLLVVCLVVTVLGWRDLRVRVAALVMVVLGTASLGGSLLIDGRDTGIGLPWSLAQQLPVFDAMLPGRFGLLVAGAAGLLLGVGLDRLVPVVRRPGLGARPARGVALMVAAACVLPLVPLPLAAAAIAPTPAFFTDPGPQGAQAVLDDGATVLVVPIADPGDTDAMRWQTAADYSFAMPGGYFTGPACRGRDCEGQARLGADSSFLGDLLQRVERTGESPLLSAPMRAAAAADLARWGADAVLLGPCPQHDALLRTLTVLLGPPEADSGGVTRWHNPVVKGATAGPRT